MKKKGIENLPLDRVTSACTYTYEIDLAGMLGGMTRARGRKKVVQGFLSTDPRAEKYAGWSPYNFVMGNPIINVDPRGDTVRTVTPGMANTHLETMNSGFPEGSLARSVFSVGADGRTMNADVGLATVARGQLNEAQNQLLDDQLLSVTSDALFIVEPLHKISIISSYGQNALSNGYRTGLDLDVGDGGGYTANAPYDENVTGPIPSSGASFYIPYVIGASTTLSSYSDGIKRPSLAGEIYNHELGHALNRTFANPMLSQQTNKRGTSLYDLRDRDVSIQLGNTYLRAVGAGYIRLNHGFEHSEKFDPNGRPGF